MMETTNIETSEENYKEILSYLKDFLKTRRFIIVSILIALILALITLFLTPKTYSSKVTFIVQGSNNSKAKKGISGIVDLLSNGGGGSGASNNAIDIPAFLYPKIMESLYFQRKLYETPINLRGVDSAISFKQYVLEYEKPPLSATIRKYTIGLPGLIFGSKGTGTPVSKIDSLEYVSGIERIVFASMRDKLTFTAVEEDGTLEISTTMVNEPVAVAQLTQSAKKILQSEIILYRIAKAEEKYDFINKQYIEKKALFDESQVRLARYADRNLYNATSSSLIRRQQLENESSLLYSIYSDLEEQRLAQSIKIQEDTPTFTVINPAVVPVNSNSSDSLKTVLIFLFFGFLFSVFRYVLIVTKRYLKTLWKEI